MKLPAEAAPVQRRDKAAQEKRRNRIEGQVRGISRMISEGRY